MALRPAYLRMNVEFDDFLFALVGEERNGMPLSLMSALTRLDLDPWEQAAQLSSLAASEAVRRLASLIAQLPAGRWELKDASAIAARLILLLPQSASLRARLPDRSVRQGKFRPSSIIWLICFALLTAALIGAMQRADSPPGGDAASGAASHIVSPSRADE